MKYEAESTTTSATMQFNSSCDRIAIHKAIKKLGDECIIYRKSQKLICIYKHYPKRIVR